MSALSAFRNRSARLTVCTVNRRFVVTIPPVAPSIGAPWRPDQAWAVPAVGARGPGAGIHSLAPEMVPTFTVSHPRHQAAGHCLCISDIWPFRANGYRLDTVLNDDAGQTMMPDKCMIGRNAFVLLS